MNTNTSLRRPVSVPHLVFGLIFTGLALVWAIGEATNADLPRTAIGFPAVLIGAGLVGLIGTLVNARNRSRNLATETDETNETDETDETDEVQLDGLEADDNETTTVIAEENR
jgi:hypothetical protein